MEASFVTPAVVTLHINLDDNHFLHARMGHLWHINVHGHHGMLPSLFTSPLGRVPEQVLQR